VDKIIKFLDGKKRGIAAASGVILTWCMKYHVAPEMYLELLAGLNTLFAAWAIGDAVQKSIAAKANASAAEEV
jgi:hypothetical protein